MMSPSGARRSVHSGAEWEGRYRYSRAVAVGNLAWVAGTTAASAPADGVDAALSPDAGDQAGVAFSVACDALRELGFASRDVVRTRMFITEPADADAVGAAHRNFFGDTQPAATMVVVAGLLDPRLKVEIELDAVRGAAS